MECTVVWRVDLAGGERVRVTTAISHIKPSGKAHNPCDFFNPILFVLLRVADRFGVNHAAKVLVQRFHEKVHIERRECLIPFFYELDLRGAEICICW